MSSAYAFSLYLKVVVRECKACVARTESSRQEELCQGLYGQGVLLKKDTYFFFFWKVKLYTVMDSCFFNACYLLFNLCV